METIKLGQVYVTETTNGEMPVRLECLHPKGGWTARALTHGRQLQIKSAAQLLFLCTEDEVRGIAQGVIPNRRSKIQGPVYREPVAPIPEDGKPRPPIKKVKRPSVKRVIILTRMNLLDATQLVLSEKKKAMTTREIVAACAAKKYWVTNASTPHQTLNAALNRDIQASGTQSRFLKIERGKYTLR